VQSCLYLQHPRCLAHISLTEWIFLTTVPALTWVLFEVKISPFINILIVLFLKLNLESVHFRGFVSRDHGIMRRAFIVYIRPILEYNSVVWSPSGPSLLYLIELCESVLRSFSKRLPSLSSLTCTERLAVLILKRWSSEGFGLI
jgi:hypothetical protein